MAQEQIWDIEAQAFLELEMEQHGFTYSDEPEGPTLHKDGKSIFFDDKDCMLEWLLESDNPTIE